MAAMADKDLVNHSEWLAALRERRAARTRPYRNRISKLARLRAEIVQLRRAGASIREIRSWLIERRRNSRNMRSPVASVSAIHNFVRSLPELADA
jgi:hypothetical protein